MVEQRLDKALVVGSNPAGGTKHYKEKQNGAIAVIILVIVGLIWIDKNLK